MIIKIIIALECAWCMAVMLSPHVPVDFDVFWRAGQAVRWGQPLYSTPGYFSPAWVAVLFAPLTLLPYQVAYWLLCALSLAAYLVTMRHFTQGDNSRVAIALLCPLMWLALYAGNIDLLVLFGATIHPLAGTWLMLAKPQIGALVVVVWIWSAMLKRQRRMLIGLMLPCAALTASWLIGMRWNNAISAAWSVSAWPAGLMIGLPLAWVVIEWRRIDLALLAAPLCAPYIGPMAWIAVLPLWARRKVTLALAIAASWIVFETWRAGNQ